MLAAKFRHKVIIERRVAQGDGFTWEAYRTAWADKQPRSAREFMNAGDQVLGKAEGFFVIPFVDGIDPTMRVNCAGAIYNIEGVLEDRGSGRHWLTLPYSRGANEG